MNAPCICPAVRYTLWHHRNNCVGIDGNLVWLSDIQNAMFFMLYVNMGGPVALCDMVEAIYGDEADGGPEYANHIMHINAMHLRRKTGLEIRGTWAAELRMYEPAKTPEGLAA